MNGTFYSAGDCPVCSSFGALVLLVSISDGMPRFACPMCGVAWKTPPPVDTVDEIVAIPVSAPDGLRLPTAAEVQVVSASGVHLREEALGDWEALDPYIVFIDENKDRSRREAEVDNADAAAGELRERGFTSRACLRCGCGLVLEDGGAGYTVYCETKGCLRLTFRGI